MSPVERTARIVPPFGPLQGIRVVDSARYVAGPWAATYLGEFGAEVIHVEGPPFRPPYSEPTRTLPPLLPEGVPPESAVSESWVQYSRNKLSLGLNLRAEKGRRIFLDLIAVSDIWVESSRPGTYDRLGLADSLLHTVNPTLTIVHVSGFGQRGRPDRVRAPSYDLTGQAYSGYLSLQGNPEPEPPMRSGTAINDTVTGLAAAAAALMGHISARRSGRGQSIDVAQYEVFFTMLENLAIDYFARGVVRGRYGKAHARLYPYDLLPAVDGWVVVAAPDVGAWRRLAPMIGFNENGADTLEWAREHRTAVDERLATFCARHTCDELEELGRSRDVAILRVHDIARIARDEHFRDRGMFVEWNDPIAGRVKGAGIAPKFSETPGGVWRGAPWVGEDNESIIIDLLGRSRAEFDELNREGIIGSHRPPMAVSPATPFFIREGI